MNREDQRIKQIADEQLETFSGIPRRRRVLQFDEGNPDMPASTIGARDGQDVPLLIVGLAELDVILPADWNPTKPGAMAVLLAAVNSRNKVVSSVRQDLVEENASSEPSQFSDDDGPLAIKRREIISLLKQTGNVVLPPDFTWPKSSIDAMLAALRTRVAVQSQQRSDRAKTSGDVTVSRRTDQSQFAEDGEPDYMAKVDDQLKQWPRNGRRRFPARFSR
ncbi:MAG: hypothetical protein IID44_10985 [Planctomycetes bacterium]|nr:hypothetical protein [Planctomycetota bacterium]